MIIGYIVLMAQQENIFPYVEIFATVTENANTSCTIHVLRADYLMAAKLYGKLLAVVPRSPTKKIKVKLKY